MRDRGGLIRLGHLSRTRRSGLRDRATRLLLDGRRPGRKRGSFARSRRVRAPSRPSAGCSPASPSATPTRSATGRFWLALNLPKMVSIGISTPTMPFELGGNGTAPAHRRSAQGSCRRPSCWSVRAETLACSHAVPVTTAAPGRVPGRWRSSRSAQPFGLRLGRVPARGVT